ncbi:histone [Nanoarchaeota archaeon NZ13-N]|uniref:Histone n=1 Tax=Candidatus Nanoclepta minutus TaxID=1940235 RepID=A0A397WNL6_9ARCH|nr:MAG: histone [Nanoarchaeota archaeon NZ13-N]RIB35670.1 MAG: histone [Candidatus Nanoclepta minutus]
MVRGERGIPMAAVERILKSKGAKAGVERVSDKAVKFLKTALEDVAYDIAQRANSLAKHGKRTTVKPEDVKIAAKAFTR